MSATQPRPIDKVLRAIVQAMPASENMDRVAHEFEKIIYDAGFTSPELMPRRWSQAAFILSTLVGAPQGPDDWRHRVRRIFAGTEPYE